MPLQRQATLPLDDTDLKAFFATLRDGLRAVFALQPRGSTLTRGVGLFVALIALYAVVTFAIAWFDADAPWQLDRAGVTAMLADALLTLLAAYVLALFAERQEIVIGVASLLLAATIATAVIVHWPLAHATDDLVIGHHIRAALALQVISYLWWLLVLVVVARRIGVRGLRRIVPAALLAYAVSALPWWWLPSPTLLQDAVGIGDAPSDSPARTAIVATQNAENGDNAGNSNDKEPAFDAEALIYDQPRLLDAALAKIKPQTHGKIDLYVVAFAGDAEEGVFRNEVEYAEHLFSERFDAEGHVLVLENNIASIATRPLATWTNLQRGLDAIAKKMDPAEDILLVYLTTHGSQDHQLLVDLDPLPLDQIEPADLADALKTTPALRWKIIIVNACYSGGFIDDLRDDSTMVIASARADRTSFGCGADSDITYFGKAFLVEALNATTSIADAFARAKSTVTEWENRDEEEHSEPQIATSRVIEAKLASWHRGLVDRPAVPFAPAPAAPAEQP